MGSVLRMARTQPGDDTDADPRSGPAEVVRVAVDDVCEANSPRLDGVNPDHVRMLAEMCDELPPILVHYPSMTVIDGAHRLRAARLKGLTCIDARLFHGSPEEAFRVAVKANVTHGLPLTSADRRAAALRIMEANPGLSDRAIASEAGMGPRSVAALRSALLGRQTHQRRIGRDGRARPLNTTEGRLVASRTIAARPDASLREIAREAGVSVGTVRDVRARLEAGENPVPARHRTEHTQSQPEECDPVALLDGLRHDPSLRYTDSGRTFLRWLSSRTVVDRHVRQVTRVLPPHCASVVARIARKYAKVWSDLAEELDRADDHCA
jgi:hypothetical protein